MRSRSVLDGAACQPSLADYPPALRSRAFHAAAAATYRRIIAPACSKPGLRVGRQRAGAGTIGTALAAAAVPDGQTLMLTCRACRALRSTLNYLTTPCGLAGSRSNQQSLVVVAPSLNIKTKLADRTRETNHDLCVYRSRQRDALCGRTVPAGREVRRHARSLQRCA